MEIHVTFQMSSIFGTKGLNKRDQTKCKHRQLLSKQQVSILTRGIVKRMANLFLTFPHVVKQVNM